MGRTIIPRQTLEDLAPKRLFLPVLLQVCGLAWYHRYKMQRSANHSAGYPWHGGVPEHRQLYRGKNS